MRMGMCDNCGLFCDLDTHACVRKPMSKSVGNCMACGAFGDLTYGCNFCGYGASYGGGYPPQPMYTPTVGPNGATSSGTSSYSMPQTYYPPPPTMYYQPPMPFYPSSMPFYPSSMPLPTSSYPPPPKPTYVPPPQTTTIPTPPPPRVDIPKAVDMATATLQTVVSTNQYSGSDVPEPIRKYYSDELTLRNKIVQDGALVAVGKPLAAPSAGDVELARRLWGILRLTGIHRHFEFALTVATGADGNRYVGLSGNLGEGSRKIALAYDTLKTHEVSLGFTLVELGPKIVVLYVVETNLGTSGDANVCGEVKLLDAVSRTTFTGMTSLWIGSNKQNPWPLISGNTVAGSPMIPCTRCREYLPGFYRRHKKEHKFQ